jgi:predicted RNase H-like HicB family nuclease
MELTVLIRDEGEGLWSQIRELPGCFASARTMSELREALGEAVGLYLWDSPAQLSSGELGLGVGRIEVHKPPV